MANLNSFCSTISTTYLSTKYATELISKPATGDKTFATTVSTPITGSEYAAYFKPHDSSYPAAVLLRQLAEL
jgi:hypothetical protein